MPALIWRLRQRRGSKREEGTERNTYHKENSGYTPSRENTDYSWEEAFSKVLSGLAGETITVYVRAGGFSGSGFTGALLSTNGFYITLLLQAGSPPVCQLINSCNSLKAVYNRPYFYRPSSIARIPILRVAAVVHMLKTKNY